MNKKLIKKLEDNGIIQQKDNNQNNHNDVQTCTTTIIDYIKTKDYFPNLFTIVSTLPIIKICNFYDRKKKGIVLVLVLLSINKF